VGHHIDDEGQFQSDNNEWVPQNMILLSGKDPLAVEVLGRFNIRIHKNTKLLLKFEDGISRRILWEYAEESKDIELADDLFDVINRWDKAANRARFEAAE